MKSLFFSQLSCSKFSADKFRGSGTLTTSAFLTLALASPLAIGAEIASGTFNITSSGAGSIGYLPFSLSETTAVDIATSGPTMDPYIYLLTGTRSFTVNSFITESDDACNPIDCGAAGTSPEYNALINDFTLSPGSYTVAVANWRFSSQEVMAGSKTNISTGNVLVIVGDSNLIIPGTGTGSGSARLISFAGSAGTVVSESQIIESTSNTSATSLAINSLCASAANLTVIGNCAAVASLTPAAKADVVEQITPEEINTIAATTVATSRANFSSVLDRIAGLRAGNVGGINLGGNRVGAASADELPEIFQRLGIYGNIDGSFGNRKRSVNEQGYNFDNQGVTVGADYAVTDNLFVGMAFNNAHNKADFSNRAGQLYTAAYTGSLYSTLNIQDFYVDALASFGGIDYESERTMSFFNTSAKGKASGMQYASSLGAGYNHHIEKLVVGPYMGFDYTKTEVDAYRESGGASFAARYDKQNIESVLTKAGARMSYAWSQPWGVIVPQVNAEWIHESSYNAQYNVVRFVQNGTGFTIRSDNPDRDYMQLGLNMAGQFAGGISAFVSYNTVIDRENVTNHAFSSGIRMSF
jgi:outer membrane autotransporter protein